jgi:hypothetical protein
MEVDRFRCEAQNDADIEDKVRLREALRCRVWTGMSLWETFFIFCHGLRSRLSDIVCRTVSSRYSLSMPGLSGFDASRVALARN